MVSPVDLRALTKQAELRPSNPLECPTYVGPFKVEVIPGKGRGLVATDVIKTGTVVLLEKAAGIVYDPEAGKNDTSSLISVLCEKSRNSIINGQLSLMYAGPQYELLNATLDDFKKPQERPALSRERVQGICEFNTFGFHTDKVQGNGIWPIAALTNHSCLPNLCRLFLNDVLVLVANSDISRGAELLSSYVASNDNYVLRTRALIPFGIECNCQLCEYDRQDLLSGMLERRIDILDYYANEIEQHVCSGHPEIATIVLDLVDQLEQSYDNRILKPMMFNILSDLATIYYLKGEHTLATQTFERCMASYGHSITTEQQLVQIPIIFSSLTDATFQYAIASKQMGDEPAFQMWVKKSRSIAKATRAYTTQMFNEKFQSLLDGLDLSSIQ